MRRRGGRPGLLGTAARTAVVAGTAAVTVNAVSSHSAKKQAAAQQAAAPAPAPAAAPAPVEAPQQAAPTPEDDGDDLASQIKQLAQLKTAGVISEAEFEAAKAKLLGI